MDGSPSVERITSRKGGSPRALADRGKEAVQKSSSSIEHKQDRNSYKQERHEPSSDHSIGGLLETHK